MATQALFQFEKRMEEVRELSRDSALDACSLLIELLHEGHEVVTFGDIVKRKLGIVGDSIPEKLADTFSEQRRAIADERLRIKEIAEETGELDLTVIDVAGRPAIRGGAPAAFTLHSTAAGRSDVRAQLQMSIGKVKATIGRLQLPEQAALQALTLVDVVATNLLPAETVSVE